MTKGCTADFKHESFLYQYYAAHGCADNRQYVMMNEKDIEKMFWPAETETKMLLDRCGSSCKAFNVFDCCREDFFGAHDRVLKALKAAGLALDVEFKSQANK